MRSRMYRRRSTGSGGDVGSARCRVVPSVCNVLRGLGMCLALISALDRAVVSLHVMFERVIAHVLERVNAVVNQPASRTACSRSGPGGSVPKPIGVSIVPGRTALHRRP